VVASCGLNGADPDCVFRELARVVRPGGRLAFLEWGSDVHPFDATLAEVMGRHHVPADRAPAELRAARAALDRMDRWDRQMKTPADYHARLGGAGFHEVAVELGRPVDCVLSVDRFLRYKLSWTHHRLELASLAGEQGRALADLNAAFSAHRHADGHLHYAPLLFWVTATRSAA